MHHDKNIVQIILSVIQPTKNNHKNIRNAEPDYPPSKSAPPANMSQPPPVPPNAVTLQHVGRADGQCQLSDKSLFKQDVAYVNGEWIKAKSGKTFEVHGESTRCPRYK